MMTNKSVRVGVVGTGHLGSHHVKHFASINEATLVGIFDINKNRSKEVAKKNNTKSFPSLKALIEKTDAISVVTPTESHAKIALQCINSGKHVFVEKPMTNTISEADALVASSTKNNVILQIGHIERLNPALVALKPYNLRPKYIEIQRLAPYQTRGTDIPVVLDLMIHDIDIILSIVKSKVQSIKATGLSILTKSIDIANARIEFENGTVASMTSSRIAQSKIRKVKIFQNKLYSTIDLLLGLTEIYQVNRYTKDKLKSSTNFLFETDNRKKIISYIKPTIKKEDALKLELINFIKSAKGTDEPIVNGLEGREALKVAVRIQDTIMKDLK
mgnify:FL=1